MPKTWAEKFKVKHEAKVVPLPKPFAGLPEGALLYIATPAIIKREIEQISRGQFVPLADIRAKLARQNQADATCPLTTGIFTRIVAEAAWDEHLAGKSIDAITPFWRVIDAQSALAKKLTCGADVVAARQAAEGL